MTKSVKTTIVSKMTYRLYVVQVTDTDVKQVSLQSDTPFAIPPIGYPFQVVLPKDSPVGEVADVRYSYEEDKTTPTAWICNVNVSLKP